ncbi:Lysine histidine transporter-like 8 [Quillaja saponaria]|uniref:Lysine histidine transporter-like 8 n=1 Tax=Quillaja saponaria TaxID=32244 RepID=A0AAD7PTP9_QUISA|nr:Lysine histidine transporter-like 8 [Quillaja saponaria]
MGESVGEVNIRVPESALLHYSTPTIRSPYQSLSPSPYPPVININLLPSTSFSSSSSRDHDHATTTTITNVQDQQQQHQNNRPQDAWLPITESTNGNAYFATFHLLSSGIGIQALVLPFAFSTLGWAWGTICLSLAFMWQLHTALLLILLHESIPGVRFSRYLHLSMAAFGIKLGKVAALFPVMYLSGGTCVMLIITGGGTMELFFNTVCDDKAKSLSGVLWFLVFTCIAIAIAQLPNLNSIAGVSLIGAITAVCYCTLIWVLSLRKGRPTGISYRSSLAEDQSSVAKMSDVLNAVGIIFLAFRGHNVLLEIQGTMPSTAKHPSREPMCKGVTISYLVIAMCIFPLAIAGFWAYGNKKTSTGGILSAFSQFHRHQVSKFSMGLVYLLLVIHCLSAFQIYAIPVFDNLEIRYTSVKKKACTRMARTCLRLFFGGLAFFIAVAFPFLPRLAALIGGMTLPLTYAYPCFMWIAIKKPRRGGYVWCLNLALGCLGIILSALLVAAAIWSLAHTGLNANFFKPK